MFQDCADGGSGCRSLAKRLPGNASFRVPARVAWAPVLTQVLLISLKLPTVSGPPTKFRGYPMEIFLIC